ncbi:MAG TPA: carboxypeptidase regulatory-like domain-containing protein [Methylomirabilota bacterium]|nr:carboxypeptidase regulatory-like domain-containing protein [Methylomirabilota bacterium]
MKTGTLSSAAFLLTLGLASTASGDTVPQSPLQVKTYGNIPYVSGGVGIEERDRLIATSHGDNLRLSFAMQNGEYLGGAEVIIKNDRGNEILQAAADGPLFFAKLPAGMYTIEATTMGETLTRTVNIPTKGQAPIFFTWHSGLQHQALN